jgi:hypothetical protein
MHGSERNETILKLRYLSSYEHMGQVQVKCEDACACSRRVVDAHRVSTIRKESIVLENPIHVHSVRSVDAASPGDVCSLVLIILPASSSGEHRFKLVAVHLEYLRTNED